METPLGQSPAPFPIRAHHVGSLTPLVPPMDADPLEKAAQLRHDAVIRRGTTTDRTVNFAALTDIRGDFGDYEAAYYYDLIGGTPEQADAFESATVANYLAFLELCDDAAVELTV